MMLQLCTMPTAHYANAVWMPMPIIHPKNWLPVVENSRLFAPRMVRPHTSLVHTHVRQQSTGRCIWIRCKLACSTFRFHNLICSAFMGNNRAALCPRPSMP